MQLVKPIPFAEAVDKLGRKTNIGSKLSSSEWRDVPVALRERAFFSSQVESARVLQRARDGINDFLQSNRETLPSGETALATGSRADFVKQMQDFLKSEGIERTDGSLTDLAGERRLGLIFNTQTRQANDFGNWKQGQDADLLNEFPAQRFIRVEDVEEPRNSHTEFEGQVYLKTDPIWATINDDFGVPWGPWGWGCGHDVEDVDRSEAEQLGLIAPGQELQPIERDFNEGLQASTRGLDPDLLAKLQAEFGNKITIVGESMVWTAQVPAAKQPKASKPKTAKPIATGPVTEPVALPASLPAPARVSPVTKALKLEKSGLKPAVQKSLRAGLAAIDKVHDDGTLPEIPITKPFGKGYRGAYVRSGSKALRLEMKDVAAGSEHIIVHEAGHFLDHQALGTPGQYASQSSPLLAAWRKAVAESTPVSTMMDEFKTATGKKWGVLEYMLRGREIFARAYTQYITEKSGDKTLVRQLANFRKNNTLGPNAFWTKEEFAPISAALDDVFQKKGWL